MKILLASAALLMTGESVTTIGDFTYHESKDPLSDNLIVGIIASNADANVIIGCDHDRGKSVFVSLEARRFLTRSVVDSSPGPSGNALADMATVLGSITGDTFQYRIDRGESHNARAVYTGVQTAFIEGRDARALAERLAEGQGVFIRLDGANGYIDVRYNIAGIRPLLERVAEKCGDRRLKNRLSRRQ